MKRILSVTLIALLLILLVPASALAQEVPQLPALYWGTVKIICQYGVLDVPPSNIITTRVDGVERGSITVTESGKYGGQSGLSLKLATQGDILQGSVVEFYVGGVKANQTAPFRNDQPEQVNLTVSITLGDANGDGRVNALDITRTERMIAGLDTTRLSADANVDGKFNSLDIPKVERIIAHVD